MSQQPNHENSVEDLLARIFENQIRAWRGDAPLFRVFWFDGVLNSSVLILLYATTVYLHQRVAEQALLIFFGFYTVWILVSIWRCSAASETFWAMMAKFLTIAWAANALFILFFRQLELLALFAGVSGAQ